MKLIKYSLIGLLSAGALLTLFLLIALSDEDALMTGDDTEMVLSIRNNVSEEIGVFVEVIDLDRNRTEIRSPKGMEKIAPGEQVNARMTFSGFIPEACKKITIKTHSSDKDFPCPTKSIVDGAYQSAFKISFDGR